MNIVKAFRARAQAATKRPVQSTVRRKAPIRAHPAFAPMLGVWGAVCGALCVLVLPGVLIEFFAAGVLPSFAFGWARPALAGSAAALGGLMCFAAASLFARSDFNRLTAQSVRPIDPARELGSASFDAPLQDATKLNLEDVDVDVDVDVDEGEDEGNWLLRDYGSDAEPLRELGLHELDLSEFAALPGRNAVWVEEAPQPCVETHFIETPAAVIAEPAIPSAVPAAIAKLRAVPPTELSLCEMVERFAAALQDYQSAHEADPGGQSREQREAVLGEALKALATITGRGEAEAQAARDRRTAA